ncbi:MAG: hypothetical protein RSA29_01950 [Clostridium sp.]
MDNIYINEDQQYNLNDEDIIILDEPRTGTFGKSDFACEFCRPVIEIK